MTDFLALLRSLLYSALFAVWATFASLLCYAAARLCGPGRLLSWSGRLWQHGEAFLEKYILGITCHVQGLEYMPQGCCIVAMQHQSAWETMRLLLWFREPVIVLKAELLKLPIWGEAMRIYGAIPVARNRKPEDVKKMLRASQAALKQSRPIIIFPHGTRMQAGIHKPLHGGVGVLYEHLKVPVIPVTLNSGKFWARKAFRRYPGKIDVVFHPALPPGLPRDELMARLDTLLNS